MFILALPLQIVLAWFIFSCMGELLCLNLHSDASCWLISHLPTCVFLDWRTKTHMCAISICGDLTSTAAAYSIKLSWKVAAYCQTQSTMDVGPVESINHPLPHRRKTSDSVRVDDKKKIRKHCQNLRHVYVYDCVWSTRRNIVIRDPFHEFTMRHHKFMPNFNGSRFVLPKQRGHGWHSPVFAGAVWQTRLGSNDLNASVSPPYTSSAMRDMIWIIFHKKNHPGSGRRSAPIPNDLTSALNTQKKCSCNTW